MVFDNKLVVASITSEGNVQVTSWSLKTNSVEIKTLRRDFGKDDHDVPGMLLRMDGYLMAFYCKHHQEPLMYYHVTAQPDNVIEWQPEQTYDAGVKDYFTYSNPFQLSAENGRIYNFWRGIDFNPTWSAPDDNGKTWSKGANHIYFRKGDRPYVKYASNDIDTIHFAFTEAHPETMNTSIYHAYYISGYVYKSDGRPIRKLQERPVHPSEATLVYNGTNALTGRAWVWDMAIDSNGFPVIVFSTHPSPIDIRYCYARWNGSAWEENQIAFAGTPLYKEQEFYAGGICLDPDNVNVVYLSSNVNITTGGLNPGGHYELYKGDLGMNGTSWRWQAITANSSQDNLRPIVPTHHPGRTFVMWLQGKYNTYQDYKTKVVAVVQL